MCLKFAKEARSTIRHSSVSVDNLPAPYHRSFLRPSYHQRYKHLLRLQLRRLSHHRLRLQPCLLHPTSSVAQSSGLLSAPASSIASGSGVGRSTGTSTKSVPVSQPSSSATVLPLGGGGGLSTGAKAGIGVGATIAGLFLALGAFFLGMSVHRKSKRVDDAETGTDGGKPELEGEGIYKHEITPEMEAGMSNPPVHDRHVSSGFGPPATANELPAHLTPVVVTTQSELHGTPQHAKLSPGVTQEPRHELYGNVTYDQSPVSPISDAQHSGLNRRDTYDDPRLVQNPWAQNDTLPQR
jgi:hypothetical protein